MQEHCDRLVAARLQADIMGTDTVIVARTDAEAASLLDSNIDPRDHPFILGATNPNLRPVNEVMSAAAAAGASADKVNDIAKEWTASAGLMRYPEAVARAIERSGLPDAQTRLKHWASKAYTLGHDQARALAAELLGGPAKLPHFDWEAPRSREGYYKVRGGVDYCVARARAFAPHADLLWMETAKPILEEARQFAHGVHEAFPRQMLAYNLSPSFNWDSAGMTEAQMASFNRDLGQLGYVFQFITLAGFHADGLITARLSREYGQHGIIKYVDLVQRQERAEQVDLLTHQRWSGADLMDRQVRLATGGISSTSAMGEGVTEAQFKAPLARL
eukprot:TRINITY_DN5700_c1_g1_i2.p2 TRINITY_DN5700_c1_g1~~TRINITY_DN5700_c1_g1_i2.p2  ORF type:complete len:332 (-),score=144.84 TRINITY_DN5700_c1_g1_i2:317-1312(-)